MTYNNNDDFEDSDGSSIYTDEDYEKLTEGTYGKEIFVPNDESNNTNSITFSAVLDEQELRSKIDTNDVVEYFFKTIKKTVKCEDVLVRQIGYTGLSSYIEDDPINLGIMAPTSEGKTYPVEETLKFFPKDDVYKIGSMSAKVLVRKKGILVNKNLEPIEEKLKALHKQKYKTKDQDEKDQISEEIDKLYEDAKTLIDLRGKILVFLEPPDKEVWTILKPILSHDSPEIEYPFVNQTDKEGHQTKDVVVRGWPSCIFCSARDESKWDMWPEIKSRFLISSPNMIPQKYQESKELISIRKGLPNLIQQQIVLSDNEIELARDCILLIKQKITELRSKNGNNKISIWIPYANLLEKELPATKGTDVRLVKRIFSLLNVVPIVKFNLRKILVLSTGDGYKEEEEETSVIADLDDLKEVLSITQNFEGIPKYKIEFFNNIFYPCYKAKNDVPDSSKDGTKQEDRIAVTARQLCDTFKKVKGKAITTDNLKKTYLDELMSNGLIDYDKSNIDAKQYIYYPIVEPLSTSVIQISSTEVIEKDKQSLSLLSNSDQFDNVSQYSSTIYEKITKNISESWLFSEIMRLLRYRIDIDSIQGPLADFLNNHDEFKILDNTTNTNTVLNYSNRKEKDEGGEGCCCSNINNNQFNSDINRLTIRQFIKYYIAVYPSYRFDNKRSPNIAHFGKISLIKSNLAKFDNKDIITKNIQDEKISNTILKEQLEPSSLSSSSTTTTTEQSSLIPCNHCSYQGKSEHEVLVHSVNTHPGLPARPDHNLLELIKGDDNEEQNVS
jgi:hypothetical protein